MTHVARVPCERRRRRCPLCSSTLTLASRIYPSARRATNSGGLGRTVEEKSAAQTRSFRKEHVGTDTARPHPRLTGK